MELDNGRKAVLDDPSPMLVNNLDVSIHASTQPQTVYRPWILNPDLTNQSAVARSAAATTGVDNRNNVEQVFIATPAEGEYVITVTHNGGLPNGETPSAQWASVISSGDIPLSPKFNTTETLSGDQFAAGFESDPGAYLELHYTTDIRDPQTWTPLGVLVTESSQNIILPEVAASNAFFRLKRVTVAP